MLELEQPPPEGRNGDVCLEEQVAWERSMLSDRMATLPHYFASHPYPSAFPQPIFKPSLIPPRPWGADGRPGGYWTAYAMAGAEPAAPGTSARLVAEIANWLQAVPYRINAQVLAVAREALRRGLTRIVAPAASPPEGPPRTLKDNPTAIAHWYRVALRNAGREAARLAEARQAEGVLSLAEALHGRDHFYYPQACRSKRLMPYVADLAPGSEHDFGAALIEFADGKEVEPAGRESVALHLAACHGITEGSTAERLEWVASRGGWFQRVADDPLTNLGWTQTKRPWQTLAAILDHVEARPVSHLPVAVATHFPWRRALSQEPHVSASILREAREAGITLVGFGAGRALTHAADARCVQDLLERAHAMLGLLEAA